MGPHWQRPARRMLVGNTAGIPAPAWKHKGTQQNSASTSKSAGEYVHLAPEPGSKLLISLLPHDVDEEQVIMLCEKTVGPLKGVFLIYNNQGGSKGMAVVHFQRKEDAMKAREMYNHKVIDGKRPIRCELILDEDIGTYEPPMLPPPPSLLSRISFGNQKTATAPRAQPLAPAHLTPPIRQRIGQPTQYAPHLSEHITVLNIQPFASHRPRIKKGPKRLRKLHGGATIKEAQTVEDLDRELEEWRANAPPTQRS